MNTPSPAPAPEILSLAGHAVRWRLLAELARSDRVVAELTAAVGEPQNLVSYHLGKLKAAGLVSSRRSDADRRDAYYALDLERVGAALSAAGGALHPGLRLEAPEAPAAPRARVLFLCTGNSARSQMAEALTREISGGAVEALSAGSAPRPIHPNAERAMAQAFGLSLAGQAPKSMDVFAGQAFHQVVTLCDRVREVCPDWPGAIHWSLPNPVTGEADEVTWPAFEWTGRELARRIRFLLAALGAQAAA